MGHIFLYGAPSSGKSTVGKLLASSLHYPFLDLDQEIEKKAGMTIPDIMAEKGEPVFRDLESTTLEEVTAGTACVIALGGGTLLRDSNRTLAESAGDVIFLEAGLPTLLGRMKAVPEQRPLVIGDKEEKLKYLLARRKSHYESYSLRISNDANCPQTTELTIRQLLGRFHIRGTGTGYDVIVQTGGLDQLGEMLRERCLGNTVAVVADSNISPLYGKRVMESLNRVGFKTHLLTFQAGEQYKTLGTVSTMWREFLKAGLDRKSTVIALGGGVTGDLSGFAAAGFLRGIRWVGLPTSVVAMVDSSLGGKTACDLPEGKNLIGAFHFPSLVLADPDTLSTLPDAEMRSGLGEVVKHGVIADPALFELCTRGYDKVRANLPEIIYKAMAVKIRIIEADPLEHGSRATLNLGHTIGHALEKVSRYRLRHGEAIAIGMVAEARLAERLKLADLGLSERISRSLTGLGLPVEIPSDLSGPEILRAIWFDKKREAGIVRFALPLTIGEVRVGVDVKNLEMSMLKA